MIQKIKSAILSLAILMGLGAPALVPAIASADAATPTSTTNNTITQGLCTGANDAASNGTGGCITDTSDPNGTLSKVAHTIVNIFSIIVGIVAVIMIIYGGFRYITSGGDSGRVGNAKNTLIYAIIGMIIVALAQFLVHYVFTQATNAV
jgi:predicted permease